MIRLTDLNWFRLENYLIFNIELYNSVWLLVQQKCESVCVL